jgi:ATP-dependent DNA helicase RecQ
VSRGYPWLKILADLSISMPADPFQIHALLKRWFGFKSFRPLQEEIIRDALAHKDVLVVLPTGGGKSLCFQLPALARPGLTVVVSPLIALMKDQVDALQAAGVPATFLNSSLAPDESRKRLRGLHQGEYQLLYVAPERLMLSGFLEDLRRWQVNLFAIDEAHCISEWGHDFRPEYRQLASLRDLFPQVAVMALTATATERVRGDIVKQLHLRDASVYVASFNRPNLSYRVAAKKGAYAQVVDFIRSRANESGIIYCQARKTTEFIAEKLSADGVRAAPYHAGLDGKERSRNQEAFLRDRTQVICATVAFGMGINKSNVRFVIHYDLPKNIEGYYQETGRAGRDGLPSECLLLFSPGDRVKYGQFIDEKPDPREREIARAQLEQMVNYAQARVCRRTHLLNYFGEKFPGENCGACDNCLTRRKIWDSTTIAQKFLSCVYRIREKSGASVDFAHVLDVLCGEKTEKVLQWDHQTLSTYGIGVEHKHAEWAAFGRELVRLGYLSENAKQADVIELTEKARVALRTRQKITFARPVSAPESRRGSRVEPRKRHLRESHREDAPEPLREKFRAMEVASDKSLFEMLRALRSRLADERNVPAFIVFSDVSLREMASQCPRDEAGFSRISGVGEKKLREFGPAFLAEIAEYRLAGGSWLKRK